MRRPPRSLEPGGNQAGRKHEQDEWNQIGQIQRQGEAGECQAVPFIRRWDSPAGRPKPKPQRRRDRGRGKRSGETRDNRRRQPASTGIEGRRDPDPWRTSLRRGRRRPRTGSAAEAGEKGPEAAPEGNIPPGRHKRGLAQGSSSLSVRTAVRTKPRVRDKQHSRTCGQQCGRQRGTQAGSREKSRQGIHQAKGPAAMNEARQSARR